MGAELDQPGGEGDEHAQLGGAPVLGPFVRAVLGAVVLATDRRRLPHDDGQREQGRGNDDPEHEPPG